jgi:hypothetical protein
MAKGRNQVSGAGAIGSMCRWIIYLFCAAWVRYFTRYCGEMARIFEGFEALGSGARNRFRFATLQAGASALRRWCRCRHEAGIPP